LELRKTRAMCRFGKAKADFRVQHLTCRQFVRKGKSMRYEVTIEVEKLTAECHAGHKEGDSWTISSPEQPLAVCPVALAAIWQKVYAMLLGAEFWWSAEPDVARFSCPDMGIVTFKISRRPVQA